MARAKAHASIAVNHATSRHNAHYLPKEMGRGKSHTAKYVKIACDINTSYNKIFRMRAMKMIGLPMARAQRFRKRQLAAKC